MRNERTLCLFPYPPQVSGFWKDLGGTLSIGIHRCHQLSQVINRHFRCHSHIPSPVQKAPLPANKLQSSVRRRRGLLDAFGASGRTQCILFPLRSMSGFTPKSLFRDSAQRRRLGLGRRTWPIAANIAAIFWLTARRANNPKYRMLCL